MEFKLIEYITNPLKFIPSLGARGYLNFLSDKLFLKLSYRARMDKKLNLENPRTFTEKLQWLKLFDRNPLYTELVDKYAVRSYVKETIGKAYLIDLLGVWSEVDDIDFSALPKQFVLKTTHGSGGVVICEDKSKLDIEKTKSILNKSLESNYYWRTREWPYKNIEPKIICEEYINFGSKSELKDYKFMCFNGQPKIIQVMSNRQGGTFDLNHYNLDWKAIDIKRKNISKNIKEIKKPNKLDEMIEVCKKLSKDCPFVRIDLYYVQNEIYFGEITFFPVAGFMDFENEEDDLYLGNLISLDH